MKLSDTIKYLSKISNYIFYLSSWNNIFMLFGMYEQASILAFRTKSANRKFI